MHSAVFSSVAHEVGKNGDLEKFRKGTGISIIIVVVIAAVVVSYINTIIVIQSVLRVALI